MSAHSLKLSALAVCVAATVLAVAGHAETVLINGRETLNAVQAQGECLVPAAPFFRSLGGDMTCTEDGYCVDYGGHRYRFWSGKVKFQYDQAERELPCAPVMREGQLYVPPEPFVTDRGGRFYRDRGNWRIEVPAAWTGTAGVRIDTPLPGSVLRSNYVIVDGYATPGRTLQVILYWYAPYEPARGRIIGVMPLRVQANGYYQARLALAGNGHYRAVVQLVDDRGGVEEELATVFQSKYQP